MWTEKVKTVPSGVRGSGQNRKSGKGVCLPSQMWPCNSIKELCSDGQLKKQMCRAWDTARVFTVGGFKVGET